jgi:hypothetical protein
MPGYWWQCEHCGFKTDFHSVSKTTGICRFIRDVLCPSDFDQTLLLRLCTECNQQSLRITFEFPRKDPKDREEVRVLHIIGLIDNGYLPMMWETYPTSKPQVRWLHFNYMNEKQIWGLNKASVWTAEGLQEAFGLYEKKTGRKILGAAAAAS